MRLALAALLLACAAPTGTASEPILGGQADGADAAVVALFVFSANGPQDDSECTGTVVSPHVVLTAAHCLAPEIAGPIDHVSIFLGSDSNDATQLNDPSLYVDVAETHFDPDFDPNAATHDVGAVVAASPLPPAPIAMNHDGLGSGDVGAAVHVAGYGESSGGDMTTGGARLAIDAKIFSVDDEHLGLDDVICFGDSGGPTFLEKNGAPVVAGIHSFGPPGNCVGIGEDTRVDKYTGFVDPIIDAADPGFLPGGCNTSGGPSEPTLAYVVLGLLVCRRTRRSLGCPKIGDVALTEQ